MSTIPVAVGLTVFLEGYSTMCGHATIALGRFLVETQDHVLFPNRNKLKVDQENREVHLRLHAPCGIVRVTVPVKFNDSRSDALGALGKSTVEYDQLRLVSFLSVPSFSVLTNLELEIPVLYQWPELIQRTDESLINESFIKLDIAFGGAFYAIARASELGFRGQGMRVEYSRDAMKALDLATSRVKSLLKKKMPEILSPYSDAVEKDLQFLYGISVVDDALDKKDQDYEVRSWKGKDRNLCFFADQQLDRSPTGSCVSARVALAATNGALKVGETWEYHSIVSEIAESEPFLGTAVERVCIPFQKTNATASPKFEAFVVKVEGRAWYVGAETHVHEGGDTIGKGFRIDTL